MIDPAKSVVIVSHPRSGSTWFQKSLRQHSLGELFNLNLGAFIRDNTVKFVFIGHGYSKKDEQQLLEERFRMYDTMVSIHGAVSVKLHSQLLTPVILEFLHNYDNQWIKLERRSKYNTFWSLLIAWQAHKWHEPISSREITIDRMVFNHVITVMNHDIVDIVGTSVYYEDALLYPTSDWFKPAATPILDEKSKITISNLDSVHQWLEDSGHQEWKKK